MQGQCWTQAAIAQMLSRYEPITMEYSYRQGRGGNLPAAALLTF